MTVADKPWNQSLEEVEVTEESPVYQHEFASVSLEMGEEGTSVAYLFHHEGIGATDKELGIHLCQKFLESLLLKNLYPNDIVLVHDGVFLAMETSPVIGLLQELEERGVSLAISEDSAAFYEIKNQMKVGHLCSMDQITVILHGIDKVVSL